MRARTCRSSSSTIETGRPRATASSALTGSCARRARLVHRPTRPAEPRQRARPRPPPRRRIAWRRRSRSVPGPLRQAAGTRRAPAGEREVVLGLEARDVGRCHAGEAASTGRSAGSSDRGGDPRLPLRRARGAFRSALLRRSPGRRRSSRSSGRTRRSLRHREPAGHPPDEVPPGGFEEEGVGQRIGGFDATVAREQDLAQLLAEARATGFAGHDHRSSRGTKPLGEALDLSRLAELVWALRS